MISNIYNQWLDSFRGLGKDIWLLSLVNFINRLGSMVVLFLTLYLTEKKGFSIEQTGFILVFNGIGAVIGTYLGGWLTDRIGYYWLQITALHLQGLVLLCLPLMHGALWIAGTVFCLALVSEVIRPANQTAFIAHSTPELRTRAISLNRMGVNLSFTAAPAIGGFLILRSWETIFWVDAVTCLAAAWMMICFLKPKAVVPKSLEDAPPQPSTSAYRDKHYLKLIGLTFINAVVFMQIIWTIPYFFRNFYHWETEYIGKVLAANGLLVALVEMPLVYRIEKKYPALSLVRTGLICYGVSHLFLLITGWPPLVPALLYIIAISFGEIFVMPFSFSYGSKLANAERQGQYMGLFSLAYAASQIVAPFVGTQMIHHFGFPALWVLLAVLSAFSFFGTRLLEQENTREQIHPA